MKKRVQSPAQKAALEKGRATALANRLARKKEKEDALESKKKQQNRNRLLLPKKLSRNLKGWKRKDYQLRPVVAASMRQAVVRMKSLFNPEENLNLEGLMTINHHHFILCN